MMDPQQFFNTLSQIEASIDFIRNTRDIKDMVEQAKYLQTTMARFGTLSDLLKELDVIREYIYVTKQLLTIDEAAHYLGVSKSYVYRMSCEHEITTYKPKGRLVYIDRDELNEWIKRYKFEPITKIKGLGLLKADELNKKHKL